MWKFFQNVLQWIIENLDIVMKIGIPMVALFLIISHVPDITERIRKFKLALKEVFTPLGFAVTVLAMLVFYFFYELYRGLL